MRWILVGCGAVVVFAAAGAFASEELGFDYAILTPGSLAIYAVAAFLTARDEGETRWGVFAGGTVAFVEATVGWTVSWVIGPGALDDATPGVLIGVVLASVALGAIVGLVAGLAAIGVLARPD